MKAPLLQGDTGEESTERIITSFERMDPDNGYPENRIKTSRYTVFSYLPKSMFEQFRRMANIYFLVLGIIALVAVQTNYYLTSVEPAGLLLPMIMVVSISVVKDGYEDLKRHRTDAEIDAKPARAITINGNVSDVNWSDITVGSAVLLLCDDEVPADVVIVACGGVQGPTAYVETAAIDGETNLKLRLPCLPDKDIRPSQDKSKIDGSSLLKPIKIVAENPNPSINVFNGSVHYSDVNGDVQSTLSEKHLVLRGSVVRATEWAIAITVYTGSDTKLALNSKAPPSKISSIDRIVNKTLLIAICIMVIVCILSMVFQVIWMTFNDDHYYLCIDEDQLDTQIAGGGSACNSAAPNEFLSIFTFATLYNNFVCISMYVSLEMIYLWQAYYMQNDLNMYDEATDTPAVVHNSSLTADLGQIEFVLSDKTGTLTKNNMCVKRASIDGVVYGKPIVFPGASKEMVAEQAKEVFKPMTDLSNLNFANDTSKGIGSRYFRVLAICHTAMLMPDAVTGELNVNDFDSLMSCLQAESPDEVALVEASALFANTLLIDRDATSMTIRCTAKSGHTIDEKYELLAINEFESDRKRMSLLVRIPGEKGSILLCKGADTSMMPHMQQHKQTKSCLEHIETFAATGLRTLVMSERYLDEAATNKWMAKYKEASNSILNRSELLSKCAIDIEQNMLLLGAIGIEDELQDDVANAIGTIRSAGINMWMITGDKPATAMAIGQLSGLLCDFHRDSTEQVVGLRGAELETRIDDLHKLIMNLTIPHLARAGSVVADQSEGVMDRLVRLTRNLLNWMHIISSAGTGDVTEEQKSATAKLALVVDGISLEGIWASRRLQEKFTAAANVIPTVIASRVSPLQKATLVNMVKRAPGAPVTLAVGDGANDVGMIHEARVGVGISGKEGRHASNAADFAIGQFRFIVPLLLHHGRFNYVRASKLVLYSFFKNLVLVSVLFYYCFYSGISGTIFVDSIVMSGFNFYLGLPIIVLGATDWDITKEEAMAYPALAYAQGRKREELNMFTFFRTCVMAFFQGLVLYAICIRIIAGQAKVNSGGGPAPNDNYDIDGIGIHDSDGRAGGIYSEGFVLFTTIVISMSYKVVAMGSFNYIGALCWICSLVGYFFFVYLYNLFPEIDWYGVVNMTMRTPAFWLAALMVPIVIMIIDQVFENLFAIVSPTSRDKLRAHIDQLTGRAEDVFKEGRLSVDAKGNPLSDAKTDRFPRMVTEDFSPLTAGQSISDETGSFHI